jgi:phosphoribosylglycinamide formyltransferase-1
VTLRLGIFASHGGTNLQAILDACAAGTISATPAVVVSNNSKSRALERARNSGIDTVHLSSATHPDPADLDKAILDALVGHAVDLVALAGYMKALGPNTVAHYRNRIVNVHPALLPRHGGTGLYGGRVHEAVLAAGDAETGVTVHLVDEEYDHGLTLAQAKVPVLPDDTIESLAARVLPVEHRLYVETIGRIASGELKLPATGH